MTNSTQNNLRDLARAHYEGLLSRDNYRNKRAQLLDTLVGEAQEEDYVEEDTLTTRPRGPLRRDQDFDQSMQQNLLDSRWPVIIFTIVMAIVVLIVLIVYPSSDPSETEISSLVVAEELQVAQQLVESFVVKNAWDQEAVAQFESSWNSFSVSTRNLASKAVWFKQFEDELQARILEQRALTDLNKDASKSVQEQILVSFGNHLGIRLP